MKTVAFKMKLKPNVKDEYKKRHDEIWPELSAALINAGIYDYSIFLDEESNTLFAVQKLKDDNCVKDLHSQQIIKKWWLYMADLMETHDDNSPVTTRLELMFFLKN